MAGTLVAIMLIWGGGLHGGPATIEFASMAACQAARAVVEKRFPTPWLSSGIETACIEVRK